MKLMELAKEMALSIEKIIEQHKIRDWVHHTDVQNCMKVAIEDYLFVIRRMPKRSRKELEKEVDCKKFWNLSARAGREAIE